MQRLAKETLNKSVFPKCGVKDFFAKTKQMFDYFCADCYNKLVKIYPQQKVPAILP